MTQFKKSFDELFIKENNSYRVLNKSVRIGDTLFTSEKISVDNSYLDFLSEKDLGGEYINEIYCVTCYFNENEIVSI